MKLNAKYQLSLNYQGRELIVEVDDLETATNLLNDPVAAQQYIGQNLFEQSDHETDQDLPGSVVTVEEPSACSSTVIMVQAEPVIWSTKKTTSRDQESTLLLLLLRKKLSKQFADKKTRKSKLWADIAKTLVQRGYNLGDTPAEKCRQKFTNLQKAYFKYINNQKTTGAEKMEIPTFFEEIHEILGDQHKVNPIGLMDTEEDIPSTPLNPNNSPASTTTVTPTGKQFLPHSSVLFSEPSTSSVTPTARQPLPESDIENRFSRKTNFKKYSKTNDLIKEVQEDREKSTEQFEFFRKHLKKTEEQRDRLLSILEKSMKRPYKRKHSISSSESE